MNNEWIFRNNDRLDNINIIIINENDNDNNIMCNNWRLLLLILLWLN